MVFFPSGQGPLFEGPEVREKIDFAREEEISRKRARFTAESKAKVVP
jgi:hypothetical protein